MKRNLLTIAFRESDVEDLRNKKGWEKFDGNFEDLINNILPAGFREWDTQSVWYDKLYTCDFYGVTDVSDEEIETIKNTISEFIDIEKLERTKELE